MNKAKKITQIVILVSVGLHLTYEILALIFPSTLKVFSPVIQDWFFQYPFSVVAFSYLSGHFIIKHSKTYKIYVSLSILVLLMAIAQALAIWIEVNILIWYILSFALGGVFWSQGSSEPFYLFRLRKK